MNSKRFAPTALLALPLLLSGCAASPPVCPLPARERIPEALRTPPPAPGAFQERLDRIVERGRGPTSGPTSTPSRPTATP